MIKPLGGILLVEQIEVGEKTTKTGLVLSHSYSEQGPKMGKVIDMGNGEQNYKGELLTIPDITIGDTVYYPDHAGTQIEDEDGNKFLLINSKNILAKKA